MNGIVDRFEGEYAVIEIDGQTKDIHKCEVDSAAAAGDCVRFVNGKWVVDVKRSEQRKQRLQKLMDEVWEEE